MAVFCTCYISAYELPDNKPFLLIHEELFLGFSFFDLGYNCNILAQLYLVGVVQFVSLKETNRFFCNNSVVTAVTVYQPGKPFQER